MIFDPNPMAFWILAALVTVCALAVVRARKLYHAGLGLVGSLFGVAGMYVLLQAHFLAGLQVLVYVGAISVMLLFAIMLTQDMMTPGRGTLTTQPWVAGGLCVMLLGLLVGGTLSSTWVTAPDTSINPVWSRSSGFQSAEAIPSVKALAHRFLDPYTLPFEMVSVMILVALIGAVVLARKDDTPARTLKTPEESAP